MPAGTCPTDPDHALIWLYDAVKQAADAQDLTAVARYLEMAADTVERTRLSLVGTDPPPEP
jgi:hypothetical protein